MSIKVAVALTRDIFAISAEERDIIFEQLAAGLVRDWPQLNIVTFQQFSKLIGDETQIPEDTLPELQLRRVVSQPSVSQPSVSQHSVRHSMTKYIPVTTYELTAAEELTGISIDPIIVSFESREITWGARGRVTTRGNAWYWAPAGEPMNVYSIIKRTPQRVFNESRLLAGIYTSDWLAAWSRNMASRTHVGGAKVSKFEALLAKRGVAKPNVARSVVKNRVATNHVAKDNVVRLDGSVLSEMRNEQISSRRGLDGSDMFARALACEYGKGDPILQRQDAEPVAEFVPTEDPLLLELESIARLRFQDGFSAYAALVARQYDKIWLQSQLGASEEDIRGMMQVLQRDVNTKIFDAATRQKRIELELDTVVVRRIVEKKLGTKRVVEILAEMRRRPWVGIMTLLTPPEKSIVEAERARHVAYVEGVVGNTCGHVALYRRMRMAISDSSMRKSWDELHEFIKVAGGDAKWLKCKVCTRTIMCEHVRILTVDALGKVPMPTVRAHIQPFVGMGSFCNVCGESLGGIEALETGEIVDPKHYRDDALKQFIWQESAQLMRHVRAGPLVDLYRLNNVARDQLYDLAAAAERSIYASKSASPEEVKMKKHLYISVLCAAWLVHMIMSNPQTLSFDGVRIVNRKTAIAQLLTKALDIVLLAKAPLIRQIHGATSESVKLKLIEAFRSVELGGVTPIPHDDVYDPELEVDPVFIASVEIAAKTRGVPAKKVRLEFIDRLVPSMRAAAVEYAKWMKAPKGDPPKASESLFAEVALKPNATLVDAFLAIKVPVGGRIFAKGVITGGKASVRAKSQKLERSREKVKPAGAKIVRIETGSKKHVGVNPPGGLPTIYDELAPGMVMAGWDLLYRMINLRSWMLARDDAKIVALDEYAQTVRAAEDKMYWLRTLGASQGNWRLPEAKNGRIWDGAVVGLERIYDETGALHVWDTFVVEIDGVSSEILRKEYLSKMSAGEEGGKIIDRKCSKCGVRESLVGDMSRSAVEEAVSAKSLIMSFFRFYEARCPKGGLHEREGGSPCSKCRMPLRVDDSAAMAVFREYRAKYALERAEINRVVIDMSIAPRVDNKYDEEYVAWKGDFAHVLQLADMVGVNAKALTMLGGIAGAEYAEVLSGKFIAPEPRERLGVRLNALVGYVRTLYRSWSQMRVFYRIQKPYMDIGKLLDASGIARSDMAAAMGGLEDIYDDFNERLDSIQWVAKPQTVVNWVLQTLCEKLSGILTNPDAKTKKLRGDFVGWIVRRFLRNDELVTKPGWFSKSIIWGDKDMGGTPQTVDDADTAADVAEVEDVDDETAMGLDGFDMEDGGDDEDSANQVRVDGYGLD